MMNVSNKNLALPNLGCVSVIKINFVPYLFCITFDLHHLALPNLGCVSVIKINFVPHLFCITFDLH
jgi:hypothetical protein